MPSPDSWLHRRFEWGAGWVIEGPVAVTKAGGHGARRAVEREEVFVERWTQRADPCGLGRNYKLSYQVLLLTESETESDIHPPAFDIQEQSGSGICINLWGGRGSGGVVGEPIKHGKGALFPAGCPLVQGWDGGGVALQPGVTWKQHRGSRAGVPRGVEPELGLCSPGVPGTATEAGEAQAALRSTQSAGGRPVS